MWEIKKKKQKPQSCAFILQDKEGNEIRKPEEIKKEVKRYYENLYEPNPVKTGYEEYTRELEKMIQQCWDSKDTNNDDLTEEEVEMVLRKLKDEKATGPDDISNEMLKYGGRSLQESIKRMMIAIYKTEDLPKQWNEAYIKNIYKGKGNKKEMKNYRGLILNSHLPKMFESIIEMKERDNLQNMSEYQCGARKAKSTREHHHTIRTIKEVAKENKEEITAVYFDIKKCFDKMILKEAMKELWIKGIKGKHWRLIYKLNSNNILIPQTEIGDCQQIKVDEMIKQGSVLGSVISAITIDSLTRIIEKHDNQWNIGDIKMNPLLFQDDIFAVNKTNEIQNTINIIQTFQDLKRLQFHEEKTKKSIINGKRDEKIYINDIEIERVKSHKYLGKIISEKNGEKEEIEQRIKKAKGAANDCLNILNRRELKNKRIVIGKKFLQTVILPTMLFGAETWPKLTEKEKTDMNSVQTQYINRVLKLPKSTPTTAIMKEMNIMKVEHMANLRKIEYYIELQNRENINMEVRINNLQKENKLKYQQEIADLKEIYGININLDTINHNEARNLVKKQINKKNEEEMNIKIQYGKKTENISEENNYITEANFNDARTIFMMKSGMLDIRGNFKSKYEGNIQCKACNEEENTQHLFKCEKYKKYWSKLRGRNINEFIKQNKPNDLAQTVRNILQERRNIEMEYHNTPTAPHTGLSPSDDGV